MSGLPINLHEILAMPNAILAIVVVLGLAVFLHEAGHFLAARMFGIGVEEFSIGFGKALWQRKHGPTMYSLRMLPLGGFAKITGMEEGEANVPGGIYTTPRYKQALVFVAGVLMNMVLAMVLFTIVVFWKGIPDINSTAIMVDRPLSGSAAAKAGFQANDQIVALDGHRDCAIVVSVAAKKPAARGGLIPGMSIDYAGGVKIAVPEDLLKPIAAARTGKLRLVVENPDHKGLQDLYKRLTLPVSEEMRALAEFPPKDSAQKIDDLIGQALGVKWAPMVTGAMADYIGDRPGVPIDVTVKRKGKEIVLRPVPKATYEREPVLGPNGELTAPHQRVGRIGVLLGVPHHRAGFVEGIETGWYSTIGSVKLVFQVVHAMATKQIAPGVAGTGPLGIMALTAQEARTGWNAVLQFAALVSANFAVINILPIPPFDGFYLGVVVVEALARRRVNEQVKHVMVMAGFFLIIVFFVALTYRDLFNIVRFGSP